MRVLVFGTFDLLHAGHRFLLTEAGRRGDVTVIVARDHTVHRVKGFRPTQGEGERRQSLQRAFPHYSVRLGHPEDFLTPVRELHPDLILLGYDQTLPPGVTTDLLLRHAQRVERLPAFEPHRYKSSIVRKGRLPDSSILKNT